MAEVLTMSTPPSSVKEVFAAAFLLLPLPASPSFAQIAKTKMKAKARTKDKAEVAPSLARRDSIAALSPAQRKRWFELTLTWVDTKDAYISLRTRCDKRADQILIERVVGVNKNKNDVSRAAQDKKNV